MAPDLNWLLLVASGYQSNSLVKQFLTRWGLDSLNSWSGNIHCMNEQDNACVCRVAESLC